MSTAPTEIDEHHGVGTLAIHAGNAPDAQTGAVMVPISLATTFAQASPGQTAGRDDPRSYGHGWEYSRSGNPTRGAFERQIAALEHAKHAVAFSSGVAAVSAMTHLLPLVLTAALYCFHLLRSSSCNFVRR